MPRRIPDCGEPGCTGVHGRSAPYRDQCPRTIRGKKALHARADAKWWRRNGSLAYARRQERKLNAAT